MWYNTDLRYPCCKEECERTHSSLPTHWSFENFTVWKIMMSDRFVIIYNDQWQKKKEECLFGLWTIIWDKCGGKSNQVKISYLEQQLSQPIRLQYLHWWNDQSFSPPQLFSMKKAKHIQKSNQGKEFTNHHKDIRRSLQSLLRPCLYLSGKHIWLFFLLFFDD